MDFKYSLLNGGVRSPVVGLALVLLGAMAGALAAYVSGNYRASAVLRYELPLPEYRRMTILVTNEDALDAWAESAKVTEGRVIERLRRSLGKDTSVQDHLSPLFRVTRRDTRELASTGKDDDKALELLGISLEFSARAPEEAERLLRIAAAYVRDVALKDAIFAFVARGQVDSVRDTLKLENSLIGARFRLTQAQRRQTDLAQLRKEYPDTTQSSPRQLLSAAGDSSRFLPPVVQLVGVESELIEIRREVAKLERELRQAQLRQDFFRQAAASLQSESIGSNAMTAVEGVRAAVLPKASVGGADDLREVDNQLRIALEDMRARFLDDPVFVSGNSVSVSTRVSLRSAAGIGAVLATLLVLVLAYGRAGLRWLRGDE